MPVPRAVCSTEGELSELFPLYFQAGRQHRQPHTHLPERPACAPRRGWVSLAPEHQHYLEWRSTRGHGTPACPRRRAPRVKALTNFCRFAQFMRLMHSCESSIYRESRGPGTQVTESQLGIWRVVIRRGESLLALHNRSGSSVPAPRVMCSKFSSKGLVLKQRGNIESRTLTCLEGRRTLRGVFGSLHLGSSSATSSGGRHAATARLQAHRATHHGSKR